MADVRKRQEAAAEDAEEAAEMAAEAAVAVQYRVLGVGRVYHPPSG